MTPMLDGESPDAAQARMMKLGSQLLPLLDGIPLPSPLDCRPDPQHAGGAICSYGFIPTLSNAKSTVMYSSRT